MISITLRRASEEDIPFIMRTERLDGYDALVGRWDERQHLTALKDKRKAYFVGSAGDEPIGFVIIRGWAAADHVTLLHRIAVAIPGQGYGRLLVKAVVDAVFRETEAFRIWLGVFPENVRGQPAYEAAGFVCEGIARGIAYFNGTHRDQVIMSILRTDWSRNRIGSDVTGSQFTDCHVSKVPGLVLRRWTNTPAKAALSSIGAPPAKSDGSRVGSTSIFSKLVQRRLDEHPKKCASGARRSSIRSGRSRRGWEQPTS